MLDQKKKNILHSLLFSKLEEKLLSHGVYISAGQIKN